MPANQPNATTGDDSDLESQSHPSSTSNPPDKHPSSPPWAAHASPSHFSARYMPFWTQLAGISPANCETASLYAQHNLGMEAVRNALPLNEGSPAGAHGHVAGQTSFATLTPYAASPEHMPFAPTGGRIPGIQPLHFIRYGSKPLHAHADPSLVQMPMHTPFDHAAGPAPNTSSFSVWPHSPSHLSPLTTVGIAPAPHPGPQRHGSEGSNITNIPPYLRGPPQKPKQSGYAMWIGNLPPAASIVDLKDYLSRDATQDTESVFLIPRTGCAFVNYASEAACMSAIDRFHNSRLLGRRIVCRWSRTGEIPSPSRLTGARSKDKHDRATTEATSSGISAEEKDSMQPAEHEIGADRSNESHKRVPERFFVLKSLTVQDLEYSVRSATWATQLDNEITLNDAFTSTGNVYLIFSANRSGQFFGYARMTSKADGKPVTVADGAFPYSTDLAGVVSTSSETAPTATAPRGWIYDDAARGTIFWEAEKADLEDVKEGDSPGRVRAKQKWSKEFVVEWLCTRPLPFRFTHGLRNPWNDYQEVKISKDGTELEPKIGKLLMQMFHQHRPGR